MVQFDRVSTQRVVDVLDHDVKSLHEKGQNLVRGSSANQSLEQTSFNWSSVGPGLDLALRIESIGVHLPTIVDVLMSVC